MNRRTVDGRRLGEWHHMVRHDDATVARARELYEGPRRGMTLQEVAERLGVSQWTVRNWVRYQTRYV